MVEVTVAKLAYTDQQTTFVVVLQEKGGSRFLPIYVGRSEAEAIAAQLHGIPAKRPMTHDLVRSLMTSLDGRLNCVVVSEVVDHTYLAEMHLARGGDLHVVDARPSDAIAIALRLDAPLFVADGLFAEFEQLTACDEAGGQEPSDHRSDAAVAESQDYTENLRRYLEQLKPEDFGKFSL